MQDALMILILASVLLGIYWVLYAIELRYNGKFIRYKTAFKNKTLNLSDIKRYRIKSDYKAFKPTVGLYIDTADKKEDIIIPVNLFKQKDIEEFVRFLEELK